MLKILVCVWCVVIQADNRVCVCVYVYVRARTRASEQACERACHVFCMRMLIMLMYACVHKRRRYACDITHRNHTDHEYKTDIHTKKDIHPNKLRMREKAVHPHMTHISEAKYLNDECARYLFTWQPCAQSTPSIEKLYQATNHEHHISLSHRYCASKICMNYRVPV